MGLFTRTKIAESPQAPLPEAGRKIVLNFGGRASKVIEQMAAATLEAGGYVEPAPREPEIGDKMLDGTVYAGVSPDTGKAVYATPADAPLSYTFTEAQKYAKKLDAHGHQDWRVPTKDELNVLFNNRAAIGGFNISGSHPAGWYWSASECNGWNAWGQRFSDGARNGSYNDAQLCVRCVR